MTKILQKFSKFSFYNTVYSAHNENEIVYPDIDMCIGEPLVWMTPYFYCKKFSSDKKQPFIRAGFAFPEGSGVATYWILRINPGAARCWRAAKCDNVLNEQRQSH